MADTPRSIDDQMMLDFFEAKHVTPACPCCGTTRWHRLAEPFYGINYKIPPGIDISSFEGLEVVVLYCMNCGFVRQHAAHLIKRWAESRNGT